MFQATVTVNDVPVPATVSAKWLPAPGVAVYETTGTSNPPFEQIKHLLSDRPLRRPNRTKPLDSK